MPYFKEQVTVWADCLMDTCNLAYLPIDDEPDGSTETEDLITTDEDWYS